MKVIYRETYFSVRDHRRPYLSLVEFVSGSIANQAFVIFLLLSFVREMSCCKFIKRKVRKHSSAFITRSLFDLFITVLCK